jgi:hypothetical protein
MATRMIASTRLPSLSRKLGTVAFCLLILLTIPAAPLLGAIVLQYTPVDEGVRLTHVSTDIDRQNPRIPVCNLTLSIKKPGFGTVQLTHTPLFDGVRLAGYELVYEDGEVITLIRQEVLSDEITLPGIWAQITSPIDNENFNSTITIHMTVER